MSARDEARAALAERIKRMRAARAALAERIKRMRAWQAFDTEDFLASDLEAVLSAAESTLLDDPVPADEREELVALVNDARLRPGTGRTMPEVAADVILAAGFRRQGPITDAMVDAAARSNYEFQNRACIHYVPAWDSIPDDDPWKLAYREEARPALEAAEAAR